MPATQRMKVANAKNDQKITKGGAPKEVRAFERKHNTAGCPRPSHIGNFSNYRSLSNSHYLELKKYVLKLHLYSYCTFKAFKKDANLKSAC